MIYQADNGTPFNNFYLRENEEWQKTLLMQSRVIPQLEAMLPDLLPLENLPGMETGHPEIRLKNQLALQQSAMKQLNKELEIQQWRLKYDIKKDSIELIRLLSNQDVLRHEINEIQKRYEELKNTFLNYIPAVL